MFKEDCLTQWWDI